MLCFKILESDNRKNIFAKQRLLSFPLLLHTPKTAALDEQVTWVR